MAGDRRAEVLADGYGADTDGTQVLQGCPYLVVSPSEPEHDAGLRVDRRIHLLHRTQKVERSFIFGLRPDARRQSLDRLDVVIVDVRVRIDHQLDAPALALEIRSKHF